MSDIDERIIFSENLREIMKEKGIEQKTLAQVIGVSDAAVYTHFDIDEIRKELDKLKV